MGVAKEAWGFKMDPIHYGSHLAGMLSQNFPHAPQCKCLEIPELGNLSCPLAISHLSMQDKVIVIAHENHQWSGRHWTFSNGESLYFSSHEDMENYWHLCFHDSLPILQGNKRYLLIPFPPTPHQGFRTFDVAEAFHGGSVWCGGSGTTARNLEMVNSKVQSKNKVKKFYLSGTE